jgi:hypothetical protein
MNDDTHRIVQVTARISVRLDDELEAEIKRYPRGERPSRATLLQQAWDAWKKRPPALQDHPHVALLKKILASDDDVFKGSVAHTIEVLAARMLPRSKRPRTRG